MTFDTQNSRQETPNFERNPCNAPIRLDAHSSIRRLAPLLKSVATNGHGNGLPRRKLNLSRKQRTALKLQGRYMGFIRQLTPRKKAEVRRIRKLRGVLAATQKAEQLVRG